MYEIVCCGMPYAVQMCCFLNEVPIQIARIFIQFIQRFILHYGLEKPTGFLDQVVPSHTHVLQNSSGRQQTSGSLDSCSPFMYTIEPLSA